MTAVVATVAALAGSSIAAPNVVGKWKGKLQVEMPSLPKDVSPEQKKMMEAGMEMIKKISFDLVLKADKTGTMEVKGAPGGQDKKETIKWSQQGEFVTISDPKNAQGQPQKFTVSKDGKTMTLEMPKQNGRSTGKMVFVRG